jgi:hypothetical protein
MHHSVHPRFFPPTMYVMFYHSVQHSYMIQDSFHQPCIPLSCPPTTYSTYIPPFCPPNDKYMFYHSVHLAPAIYVPPFCPPTIYVQGGSDISGTLSKLHHCIKKSYFLLIISHKTVLALFRSGNKNKQTRYGKY